MKIFILLYIFAIFSWSCEAGNENKNISAPPPMATYEIYEIHFSHFPPENNIDDDEFSSITVSLKTVSRKKITLTDTKFWLVMANGDTLASQNLFLKGSRETSSDTSFFAIRAFFSPLDTVNNFVYRCLSKPLNNYNLISIGDTTIIWDKSKGVDYYHHLKN
jgi:hypothetical protein